MTKKTSKARKPRLSKKPSNPGIVKFRDPQFRLEQAILKRSRIEELIKLYSSGQLTLEKQEELQKYDWQLSKTAFDQLMVVAKETIQFLASPVSVYIKGCNFFDEVEQDCLNSKINGQLNDHKVKNVLAAYKIKFSAVGLNQLRLNQSNEDINKLEEELTAKLIQKLKDEGWSKKEDDSLDIPDLTDYNES